MSDEQGGTYLSEVLDTLKPEQAIEFSGQSGEFFRIWIVNVFLTVITLGIYSAWAKVRTKQYFYGNTRIDNSSFEYTAKPAQILKGRILAVILLIAYNLVGEFWPNLSGIAFLALMIMLPAIIVLSVSFRMRCTRWRGVNFGFKRDFKGAYRLFVPPILYVVLMVAIPFILQIDFEALQNSEDTGAGDEGIPGTLKTYFIYAGIAAAIAALAFPWWNCAYYHFLGNGAYFGRTKFSFSAKARAFYEVYFTAVILAVIMGLAVWLLFYVSMLGSLSSSGFLAQATGILFMLAVMMPYAVAISYIRAQRTNIVYSNLTLENISIECRLETLKILGLYLTNTLAILLSLGLAVPWAMVRTTRYKLSCISLAAVSFDKLLGAEAGEQAALGEEVGDFFGLDLGL